MLAFRVFESDQTMHCLPPRPRLLALGLIVPSFLAWQPVQDVALDPAAVATIDSIFASFDNEDSPGCAVTVLERSEVAYSQGYGMANLEHGIPITSTSVFRTGSVSKQFTAAVMVLLDEEGVLSLDDPLRAHLPEIPDFGYDLTLRNLIHHTSGIRDYLDLMALAGRGSDDFYRKQQALDLLARQEALNFPPGNRFLYSNSGYFLLSQVVERATGRTLRQEAQDRLFGPLGMTQTHFHDDRNEIVVNRAGGYAPLEGGGFEISMTKLDLVGDGGLFTTAEDMALWLANLDDPKVGGPSFLETLLTRGTLNDGSTLSYAMGIGHRTHGGLPHIGHGGSFVGFRAATVRFPGSDISVGLLCNRPDVNPMGLALKVAEAVLDGEMELPESRTPPSPESPEDPDEAPSLPVEATEELVGTYFSPELDVTYEIRVEGDGLVAEIGGIRTLPLAYQEADVFRALFITLRFQRDEGRVIGFGANLPRASAINFLKR